ncbi:hypothetical protein JGU66_06445 [Myxococcaceae bacterium JPH2]|nr:hypothetical protein [Myxococcaceae bacterium JPH2]
MRRFALLFTCLVATLLLGSPAQAERPPFGAEPQGISQQEEDHDDHGGHRAPGGGKITTEDGHTINTPDAPACVKKCESVTTSCMGSCKPGNQKCYSLCGAKVDKCMKACEKKHR